MESKNTRERYNLPDEVKFCAKCVVSNQRPRIQFDENGVCNACNYWERKANGSIDWETRNKEFLELLDQHRRNDGHYDVLVPSSGGKDSAMVAHKLKYQYGMNPLTVTWSPHRYTDIGWKNFQGLIDAGLDNVLGTPNTLTHRKLTRIAFEELGDPFQPFIYGQQNFPMKIAVTQKIPLIFFGENGDAEYGGNPAVENERGFDYESQINRDYNSGLMVEDMAQYGIDKKELMKYFPPPADEIKKLGVECHFWSYYHNWQPQENYYYAAEHTNFEANPDGRSQGTYSKYASLDDKVDGFHYYLSVIKFGIGRATSDAAHEIREKLITREEGIALIRRYDDEFPAKHFELFLDYCDITEDYFWEVIDSWRNENLWERADGEWKLTKKIGQDDQKNIAA
jgi:N-acetyl sugar amidotransferase